MREHQVWQGNRSHLLAFTQRLCQSLLSVALRLLAPLDGHVQCAKMVLEFQVDGSFGRGENNLLDGLAAWNLVYLRNVLRK